MNLSILLHIDVSMLKYMQKNRVNKKIIFTCFILMLLLCSGCITNPNINNDIKNDTLIVGVLSADTIYPLNITNSNFWTLIPNIFDGLVEFDEKFHIIPALAVSWNNPDSYTWRFYLRQGVKFHNGDDFIAEDVRFSIDTFHSSFDTIIREINIVDNYTIEFKTFEPNPSLLERLAHVGIIVCKNITEQPEGQKMIGTGSYKLADYEINMYTTLERFDKYWREKPEIKTAMFRVIKDDEERLHALLSGNIDIAEYNIDNKIDQIMQEENITLVKYPPLSTYIIGFDMRKNRSYAFPDDMNPTADLRVRKAIYQAIDITPLIHGPFKDLAQPASQFLTPYIFGYNPEIERLPYNVTASKQLLADTGYKDGFDIVMDCIIEGYEYNEENCHLISQQLSKVGIHVTINNLSTTEFNRKVVRERNTSMYLVGWGTISGDGGFAYDLFIRSVGENVGGLNSGYYSNAEVDRLGIKASKEMDSEKRLQLLQQGFKISLVDDVMVVPLFSQELFTLTAKNIKLIPRADLRIIVKDIRFI